jgi:hypothetical protein
MSGQLAAPEVRKLGPLIDLKQKLGDFQVGHEGEGFLFELLRLLGNRFLQGTFPLEEGLRLYRDIAESRSKTKPISGDQSYWRR